MAAVGAHANVTYGASKAAMNSLVKSMAIENAGYGIRVNAILPGLMDTPMAIERRAREQNVAREEVRAGRDRMVPLLRKMGTGWDVARAAAFLASDDASYITGVCLPVDGGLSALGSVIAAPDPQCDAAWRTTERRACGLGAELALLLGALRVLRRRARDARR